MARFLTVVGIMCCAVGALGRGMRIPVPEYTIDLDVAPEQRFVKVVTAFNSSIWDFVKGGLNFATRKIVRQISEHRGPENGELQAEINGMAQLTGIEEYLLHGIHLIYELNTLMVPLVNITWPWEGNVENSPWWRVGEMPTDAFRMGCTGIVARDTEDGTVYHARNLDFSFAKYFEKMVYTGIFVQGGKELFRGQFVAGYQLPLTGMRKGPDGWSVEVNTRFVDKASGVKTLFHNLFTEKRTLGGWNRRKTLESAASYSEAVHRLSTTPYCGNEFNVIGGVQKGTILARNADGLAYQLPLGQNRYIIMTNFDYVYHDKREWFDPTPANGKGLFHPRRLAAEAVLNKTKVLSPQVLFSVLNDQGVMAKDTIFQAIINVEKGLWNVSLPACKTCPPHELSASVLLV